MDIILLIIQSLWFIAPAYAANGFPPLMRGKRPIDSGKSLLGKRIFGDGKTWEGTIGGTIAGILVGALQVGYQGNVAFLNLNLPAMTMPLVIALTLGTMAGDLAGSFVKRRAGIGRGNPAPLLDQDGFVIMAFIFASFVYALSADIFIILLVITPPIHFISNLCGYMAKVKKTPW